VSGEAEQRLRAARENAVRLSAQIGAGGFGGGEELTRAGQDVLAAEREVARLAGEQYAVEEDIGLAWDSGAPLPHLLANGHRVFLLFYLADPDPDWDGTSVRILDPASTDLVPLGIVEIEHVHSVKFGGPNDEALAGHPLYGRGLRAYTAHRVLNSRWIQDEERINAVHPHRGSWADRLTHYLFCFHDDTVECLAASITTQRILSTPAAVLHDLVSRMLT
jgi:hypothetical protein